MKVSTDKATGPDGIPNSGRQATGEVGVDTLHGAGSHLAVGNLPPPWFNFSLMIFALKALKHMMARPNAYVTHRPLVLCF